MKIKSVTNLTLEETSHYLGLGLVEGVGADIGKALVDKFEEIINDMSKEITATKNDHNRLIDEAIESLKDARSMPVEEVDTALDMVINELKSSSW